MADKAHLTAQMLRQERRGLAESVAGRLELSHASAEPFTYSAEFAIRVQQVETHINTLAACIEFSSPAMLDDYVRFVATVAESATPHQDDMSSVFSEVVEVVQGQFPHEAQAVISNYVGRATQTLGEESAAEDIRRVDAPHAALQQQYLAALLATRRGEAMRLVLEAVQTGTSIESIYLDVLQPTLQQLGDRWQTGEISVAEEHYCSAATHVVLSQLQPYLLSNHTSVKTLVAACVGEELHELGLRMVANLFERSGWNTVYLGPNTPAESITEAIIANQAQVLAVSVTLTRHLFALSDVVGLVRSSAGCEHVKLLVGGYPFHVDPLLWKRIGADATASDAKEAVDVTDRLMDRSWRRSDQGA